MERCAISTLLDTKPHDAELGLNKAFLVPGEIKGSRAGVVHRILADIGRATVAFNVIVGVVLLVAFIPGILRLVTAWFK
jgi:hypothetical protein